VDRPGEVARPTIASAIGREAATPEHPNVDLLRRAYAAYAHGDLDVLDDLCDDDVTWHVPGVSPVAGDHEGKEEVLAALSTMMRLTDGTARLEPQAILASETVGMALVRSTAVRQAVIHTSVLVQVFRLDGGRIHEVWTYPGDPYGDDLFLSG
jgi:hypothetical protein